MRFLVFKKFSPADRTLGLTVAQRYEKSVYALAKSLFRESA